MRAGEFVRTLSDDNMHKIVKEYAKFDDQGFLSNSYLWEATEELMGLLEVRDDDSIQRTFWARVLHMEVCKNLAWRWVQSRRGGHYIFEIYKVPDVDVG